MYGDFERVQLFLEQEGGEVEELFSPVEMYTLRRISKKPVPVLPVVAAALGQFHDVAARLLQLHMRAAPERIDHFVLAVLGGVEEAREDLLRRVTARPQLLTERLRFVQRHMLDFDGRDGLRFGGCTVLHIVSRMQQRDLARQLLELGAEHCLSSAIQAGDVEWVRRNASRESVNAPLLIRDGNVNAVVDTYTPLIAAVVCKNAGMVRCLLEKGASIFGTRHNQKSTPINFAQVWDQDIENGFPVLSALLREYERCRQQGLLEQHQDWVSLADMCGKESGEKEAVQQGWWDQLHPKAKEMIERVDLGGTVEEEDEIRASEHSLTNGGEEPSDVGMAGMQSGARE